jgi:tetratricopeptide (TPR) repeat protein
MLSFLKKADPAAEASRARTALNSGRVDEAVAACQTALKADPHHAESWALLARAHEKAGRIGEAIDAAEHACQEAATYPNLLAVAELHARVGEWRKAEKAFHAAVEAFPTSVSAWRGLADARRRLGRLDQVVQCAEMVASLQPENREAQLELAEACAAAGDVARASTLSREVLDAEPDNLRALHCHARCLAAERKWDEAVGIYRRLLEHPDSDEAERARLHHDLAVALRRLGQDDAALEHLAACTDLQPNFLPAYRTLLELHRQRGELSAAIQAGQKASQLKPEEAAIWRDLGQLHVADGNAKAALQAFRRAVKEKPGDTESIAGVAEALSVLGQHEKARSICEKLVLKRAFQARPHLAYARILRNSGDLPGAQREVNTTLSIEPGNAEARRLKDELATAR